MKKRVIRLHRPPSFLSCAAVGGREEAAGTLGGAFDFIEPGDKFGMPTWELAEGELGRCALNLALKKVHMSPSALSYLFAGDLQNQCVASSSGLYPFGIPYVGLYGACSTCTEALMCLSVFLSEENDAGLCGAAVTTSHNCAAERQFRTPLEYGGVRSPTAQWTATAAGAFLLTAGEGDVILSEVMPGKIVRGGITDATDMGAAMAPAAADTILTYFRETGADPASFDAVVTGDLGKYGSSLLLELLREDGLELGRRHRDCGCLLYDFERQDIHAGGSGCGCSASVLAAHFLPSLRRGEMKDILFLSTGALMSPGSVQQGENIAGVAPLIRIRHR